MCAELHIKSSLSSSNRTMLDCDLLSGLDELLEIIANDSQKLVVIACERLWESELCLAEITIAKVMVVPTL
eukprot:845292-Amphidinium_carterae.1